jgi:anhydro-N-acetylmuramic acid kinase
MARRLFLGLSTGSSATGVDAALVEVAGTGQDLRLHLVHFLAQPFSRDLRDLLLRASNRQSVEPRQPALIHRVLGETMVQAARQTAEAARIPWQKIMCLGMSGFPLWHDAEGRYPCHLSLGMAPLVAEKTGLTVVSDFRSRDLVVGGQGYPLTPVLDDILFRHPTETRLLVHLGGMATVLYLPPGGGVKNLRAFQATPCTVLLDGLMRLLTNGRESFDAWGKHAVQGCCIEPLLERWLGHPHVQRLPPKTVPWSEFGEGFLQQAVQLARSLERNLHDVLCTATHFVARALADAIRRMGMPLPPRLHLSGGGVRNGLLWRLLGDQLPGMELDKLDSLGVPAEARKALAFAGLAALTLDGTPANAPGATGASGSRLLGSLTPGASDNWARCLKWMAGQNAPLARRAA